MHQDMHVTTKFSLEQAVREQPQPVCATCTHMQLYMQPVHLLHDSPFPVIVFSAVTGSGTVL